MREYSAASAIMAYSAASMTPVNVTRAATLDVAVSTAPINPINAVATHGVLNRGEMAVFIERALGNLAPNPNPTNMFSDVLLGNPFKPFIEELYNDGITSGCTTNPLNYCPASAVTRGQMAVFLVKAFNIPLP